MRSLIVFTESPEAQLHCNLNGPRAGHVRSEETLDRLVFIARCIAKLAEVVLGARGFSFWLALHRTLLMHLEIAGGERGDRFARAQALERHTKLDTARRIVLAANTNRDGFKRREV